MNNNMTKGHLSILKENYENACNGYLTALLNMWELDSYYGYWVADDVGGVYSYGDTGLFMNMDEIIYCVNNNISSDTFRDFLDYVVWAHEFEQTTPTLKQWCEGVFSAIDIETRNKLSDMKAEMQQMMTELNRKY